MKPQLPGIVLPKWLTRTNTMQMSSVDVVVVLALSLRLYGTAAAIRKAAIGMRNKVCMEHQPKMKLLAKTEDDAMVMQVAVNIVQRATDQLGILPGEVFHVSGGEQ